MFEYIIFEPQAPKIQQPEWKRGILSHHLSNQSRADRAEFPRSVVAAAIERSGGICQYCKKVSCTTTHHVKGRGGRDGRGVLSNAYRVCGKCSIQSAEEAQKQRMERIYPILELLSVAAGRSLKAGEIRLIDGMDDREVAVFAKLMSDVVLSEAIDTILTGNKRRR
ncbi:hypothetical protein [Cohnella yongneupensis]|uniref:HNH endonuclease n=1 Tax=Cohnella yongneupensis TaxID=425006 RepID=A0ABW0QT37_9BACL